MRLCGALEGSSIEIEADTSDIRLNGATYFGRVVDLLSFFADRLKVYLRDQGRGMI